MDRPEVSYEVRVKMTIQANPDGKSSKHIGTNVLLELDTLLDDTMYFDKDERPTREGYNMIMHTLVSGLSNNIHAAHQCGAWDSAGQLRKIIDELERAFVRQATVVKEDFNPVSEDHKDKKEEAMIIMIADCIEIIESMLPAYLASPMVERDITDRAQEMVNQFRK